MKTKKKKPKTVTYRQVSTMAMVAGNEKKIRMVIHEENLKDWVGIGWVTIRKATARDKAMYPTVQ